MIEVSTSGSTSSSGLQAQAATEELRMRNYRNQLKNHHNSEVREIEAQHEQTLQRTIENQSLQAEQVKSAYEVQISQEAEQLEERLHALRLKNEERLENEKRAQEAEFNKVRESYQARIEDYRNNAEAQIQALHKQHQESIAKLEERVRKQTAQKEVRRS